MGDWPSADGMLDDSTLAHVLRFTEWAIDDVASDLPLGRVEPERFRALARGLEAVAGLLRARSGIVPSEIDDIGDSGGR